MNLLDRLLGGKPAPPAGPDATSKDEMPPPAGDGALHTGPAPFRHGPSAQMRAFEDLDQPPQGPVLIDPRHNLYMPSRFAMGWFGGLFPNQPLPDWKIVASVFDMERFHAPLTSLQVKDKERRGVIERGKGKLFPTAVTNPSIYLRHGGTAPIGIGPQQVQQFKATTDASRPDAGNGPGTTYPNVLLMGQGFAAET